MAERPSVPHHLTAERVVPRRPVTGSQQPLPHEYPAARPTGDLASAPSIPAELSAIEELIQRHERELLGKVQLAIDLGAGAQQSKALMSAQTRANQAEQSRNRYKFGSLLSVSLSLCLLAITGLVMKFSRDIFRDEVPAAAREAVEQKTDPLLKRVDAIDTQQVELAEDVASINRKVDALARSIQRLVEEIDAEQPPQARRRPR